jgi:hypothetical protein
VTRRKLKDLLSVALQLVILGALAFALGRPLVGVAPKQSWIVLDTSGSMLALTRPSGTRFSHAAARARALVDAANAEQKIGLIVSGAAPRVLVGATTDHHRLHEALAKLEACECEGHLDEAVELAREFVGPDGVVSVLTDANEPLPTGPNVAVETFGESSSNVAIVLVGLRPRPATINHYEGIVEVANFSTTQARAQLRITIDGRLIDVASLDLPPEGRQRHVLADLVVGDGEGLLQAELSDLKLGSGYDALAADNRAYALLAPESELPVHLIAPAGEAQFVRAAIQANRRYRLIEHAPAGSDPRSVLVVAGGPVPTAPGRYLVMSRGGSAGVIRKGPLEGALVTDWRLEHPLMQHVSLDGIVVREADRLQLSPSMNALASSGPWPLIYSQEDGERSEVVLAFDPEDSNLPMRVAFPVLVYNALDWLLGLRSDVDTRRMAGQRWVLPMAPAAQSVVRVEGPMGAGVPRVDDEGVIVEDTARAGLYRVHVGDTVFRIAASFGSARESDLRAQRTSSHQVSTVRRSGREAWSWCALAALGLLILEWRLFHRRLTV